MAWPCSIDLSRGDYKQQISTYNEAVDQLVMLWRKLAAHYADRDPERVFFEIMNEPEVSDPFRWAGIQARTAAAHPRGCAKQHDYRHRAQLLRHRRPAYAAAACLTAT